MCAHFLIFLFAIMIPSSPSYFFYDNSIATLDVAGLRIYVIPTDCMQVSKPRVCASTTLSKVLGLAD